MQSLLKLLERRLQSEPTRADGQLTSAEIARFIRDLCSGASVDRGEADGPALEFCARHGWIYRDVTLDNALLDHAHRTLLCDFGSVLEVDVDVVLARVEKTTSAMRVGFLMCVTRVLSFS